MSQDSLVEEDGTEEQTEFEPTFDASILRLNHSFGYDCKRLFNIVLIDDDTLVFASGKFLHYFSISKKKITIRESVFGAGIGFITKNNVPEFDGLLTIGENGTTPTIFIYEYPEHNVRVKLIGAAKSLFTCGSYNATGELFASQAGYPDFMLTIWRWETAEVVLRSKSFQNDILHVHFSRFNPILLVSGGLSHIKFWKMANTFTGLKLKGELGRFGKTDFSDVYALCMLSDENVISGCDWGNMLLWEAGLIKFEVCRKGRKPCHSKPITYIYYDDGEVMTVGMDGYVRIWFWQTVDLADPPDDDRFVEIEPINEFKIGDCEIRGMQKVSPYDKNHFEYYMQDGNGGFWHCDLNPNDVPKEPQKIYTCHGGKVIAAQASPASPHLLTLGQDGKIFAFNYKTKQLLLEKKFLSVGTDLLWLNINTGLELIAGFEDGLIRHLLFTVVGEKGDLHLLAAIKGHTAAVTGLSVNLVNSLLVTGAADRSIFIYDITQKINGFVKFQPLGFVNLECIPNCFYWLKNERSTCLIGGQEGEVYECVLPRSVSAERTFLSFDLGDLVKKKSVTFKSVKSVIRRNLKREATKKRKDKKRARKLREIEKLKQVNPGLQIDMESALADSEPEEEEEPLYIPPKPNPILWLRKTDRDTVWVSMGGYDAGYIYELDFSSKTPAYATIIAGGDDIEIHSYLRNKEFLLFGLVTGDIRINRTDPREFTDLRDYRLISVHDSIKGTIPRILRSYDGNFVFSIGHDGNIFSYKWYGPKVITELRSALVPVSKFTSIEDIDDPEYPSLEQEKIFAELKRQQDAAAAHERSVLDQIAELQTRFNKLFQENRELHPKVQVSHREMLLDDRITMQIRDELRAELYDVRDDLAYDLEYAQVGKQKLFNHFLKNLDHLPFKIRGVGNDMLVSSFRVQALGEEFAQAQRDIEERLLMEAARKGPPPLAMAETHEPSIPEPGEERFFYGRNPDTIIPKFSKKMLRLLHRYRSRQRYELERIYEWNRLETIKPDPNKNHPDDDRKIKEAELSMGDYKLKIGSDYEPKSQENFTYKYIEIAECRERYFNILNEFNQKLFKLRQKKKELYEFLSVKKKRLNQLHKLIPERNRLHLPHVKAIDMDEEYPEHNLEERCKAGCGVEIDDILYLEKSVEDLLPKPKPPPPPEVPSLKEIDEVEKHRSLHVEELEFLPDHEETLKVLNNLTDVDDPMYIEWPGGDTSPWLLETRFRWIDGLMNEQERIILTVKSRVNQFNAELKELQEERHFIKFNAEFLLAYMTSLNQELYILRDSEEIENQLLYNAEMAMITRNEAQMTINTATRQIEDCRKASEKLTDLIASTQSKFMSMIKGHKFYDFLRRIFKKKWRPPKPPRDDDESSSSSSSESSSSEDEEADTKSIDSLDVTAIRLDETHCPPGLERPMYDLAFKMRDERHGYEQALAEQQKLMEEKKVEVIHLQKKTKLHEEIFQQENEKVLAFRRRRQQEMNKVKVAVVLRMSQLQHFLEGEDFHDLSNAVLFDATRLKELHLRVDQLHHEAAETRRVHRTNIVHLRRMNADLKFMNNEIIRLEGEIREAMMKKFGLVVSLDDLEEEVLRKYVFDLETTAEEDLKLIDAEIKKKKMEFQRLQRELIKEIHINTEKRNILSVLQEDKNYLDEIIFSQQRNFDKWNKKKRIDLDGDIEKLKIIDKQQKLQIQFLEREICTLRMKSQPFQLDTEKKEFDASHTIFIDGPNMETTEDDTEGAGGDFVCPEMFESDAFHLRLAPDEFIMERIQLIVQKSFARLFGALTNKDNIRKYAQKTARYLGQAAYSFEGKLTDRILECLTEGLQDLIPKKYLMHMTAKDLRKLFTEILAVFDYERSEVNTEDVISGIYTNAVEAMATDEEEIFNKTQFIVESMFKQLIEVLPLEEFQSPETQRILLDVLSRESVINPKAISVENLISSSIKYAADNLLDGITAVPIRRLAEGLYKDLLKRGKQGGSIDPTRCSVGSVASVSISKKK